MRRIAIIAARGGSKRLPRKNILDLCGKPMLGHVVEMTKNSSVFDDVIVSTEDQEIKDVAMEHGATVFPRSEELATDQATVSDVCVDVLDQLEAKNELPDFFCVIYPTAVFLEEDDIISSEKKLHAPHEVDVVMGVSGYSIHPYKALVEKDGFLAPVFPKENDQKSQTYPNWVAGNGTFYWMRTSSFRSQPDFYPQRLVGHEIPAERGVDVDTPEDFIWAEKLMKIKQGVCDA